MFMSIFHTLSLRKHYLGQVLRVFSQFAYMTHTNTPKPQYKCTNKNEIKKFLFMFCYVYAFYHNL